MVLEVLGETWRREGCFGGYVDGFFGKAFGGRELDGEEKVEEELGLAASTVLVSMSLYIYSHIKEGTYTSRP